VNVATAIAVPSFFNKGAQYSPTTFSAALFSQIFFVFRKIEKYRALSVKVFLSEETIQELLIVQVSYGEGTGNRFSLLLTASGPPPTHFPPPPLSRQTHSTDL
jgi:hypothetical protein